MSRGLVLKLHRIALPSVVREEQKPEHPGLSRGVLIQAADFDNYLREAGSDVFFGDFWFKYAIIF